MAQPDTDKALALDPSAKAMKEKIGFESLFPSAFVLGEYPQISTLSETRPHIGTLQKRAHLASIARKETENQMEGLKLKIALHRAIPPASNHSYQPEAKVLTHREKTSGSRSGEWLGKFVASSIDYEKKLAFVKTAANDVLKPYDMVQVKPYL